MAFYWGLYHRNDSAALHALILGIDIVLLLITVIDGRIVPAFTASVLMQRNLAGTLRALAFLA